MHLLGAYAFSLQMLDYDFVEHPSLFDFGCGVMALPSAPKDIRDDPKLQVEFPAKALPGLCGRLISFGGRLQSNMLISS
jgi:hypothetical protein